ncbi:hypothetical protein Gasu2_58200 [Galdieria sulphuraria]|uniref:Uncharacterized protein n=1 Tax=Galdieria sulphuraria TaxID=130081 RepID=M2XW46_GALSU|nr:uncharacterized protein Gasu_46550 [Galdieria sulphuraria]EME27833.1 hypothetical protein Gasu_46550 [Galdieria sulphuraria]GJD11693.1 hypothetical protein Gasu2_58200 [Galdieria sulphuraria]|eukprot:XP_005704353.1 hypothetical protein Gasu_46550 [Galdieria sulphuraria]
MNADTSKLWALGALSASLCLVTSVVAYFTWNHLQSKNSKKITHKETNRKNKTGRKKKKKKKTSGASSASNESINDDGSYVTRQEEYNAEDSGWTQVRPRRRKFKAKE